MTKKRGDDQHGYDPERAAARSLFDRLERQAEQRPDKPARKLGDVLKVPKVTPKTKRLIEAQGGWLRLATIAFAVSMAFSAIYLRHHYIIDVLAGVVLPRSIRLEHHSGNSNHGQGFDQGGGCLDDVVGICGAGR